MFNVTLVKWLDSPTVPQFLMWSAPHPCPAWLTCVDCAKVNAPQSQRNCRVTTMGLQEKINANPTVYAVDTYASKKYEVYDETDEESMDPFEADEIFEMLRHVNDPEHPLTLEQLKVMAPENIHVDDAKSYVCVYFTPTIPHCSMATLIGLCLRVKLLRSLPSRFKVDILITPGTHSSEAAVNKQLNDKERVAAALENSHLLHVVNKCIANTDK